MVGQIFKRITAPVRGLVLRPIRSLHQAAYLLAGLTLASQVLALLRDRAFAHTFGAGQTLDLYYAAFRVPDLVFALVSSLVSAYVLIPRITGMDRTETRTLLSESATFLLGLGGTLSVALFVWMPNFLAFLYPDLMHTAARDEFILLSRLLLLQPILLGLSGVLASVTQVHRRFVLFALSPILYNLGIIFGALVLYPRFGLIGIGWGVVIGALAYLFVHVPVVIEAGVLPTLRWPQMSVMASVVRDSVPRSLALGMGAVTALALTALASQAGTGAVSIFTFASNLEAVPLGLIGASYAVAAFPALSEASALDRRSEFTNILSASARHVILWSLVAFGLIVVLRAHLVRVILGTGAFDWNATRLTAALLAIFVVGLAAQGLILLFSRALYAARKSWQPLLYQVIGGILTVALAYFLLTLPPDGFPRTLATLLKVGDLQGTPILLLAFAATLGQLGLLGCLLFALRNVTPGLARTLLRPVIDGSIAALVGGAAAYGTLLIGGSIAPLTTLMAVFIEGALAGIVGLIFAALALYVVENEEFRIVFAALEKLVRAREERATALAPSAEEPLRP
ncbi:MAG: lipid II flippase MurJ [Patescibacteria group bacterium]